MYKNILVTLDGSNLAECVFSHVQTVIKGCEQLAVTLLRVVEPIEIPYGEGFTAISYEVIKKAEDEEKDEATKYLKKAAQRDELSGAKISTTVLYGKAADMITDYVTKNKIDLIVIATHGRSGISRWVRGSVADRILHSVSVPVLMVQAPGCGLAFKK
jgi:nucleotide-binding universal stress UspA family protein